MSTWLAPFLGVLTALLGARSGYAQLADVAPEDVEFTIQFVGPAPLPYQAVRLRRVVRNISERTIGPIFQLHDLVDYPYRKGPSQLEFVRVAGAVELLDFHGFSAPVTRLTQMGGVRLFLQPGECSAASIALAAEWRQPREPLQSVGASPLFPEPGRYSVRLSYLVNPRLQYEGKDPSKAFLHCAVDIVVADARDVDRDVYQMLKNNPGLAQAVMSATRAPDAEQARGLEQLLRNHPTSSYAPYARFALSRVALRGIGLAHAQRVSTHEWNTAYTILDGLKDTDFAYQPNVLAALYRCAKRVRPDAADGIKLRMIGACPDAREVLDVLAPEIPVENWASFRVRDGSLDPVADEPGLPRVLLIGDDVSVGYTHWLRRALRGKANLHRIPESAGATGDALGKVTVGKDTGGQAASGTKDAGGKAAGGTQKSESGTQKPKNDDKAEPGEPATKLDHWLAATGAAGGSDNKALADKPAVAHAKWDVIIVNFGLDDLRRVSGRPRTTVEQYEKNLRAIAPRLKATGATLVWITTTPVPEGAPAAYRAADVAVYNAAAAKIAEEFGFAVVDLHTVIVEKLKQSKPGDLFRVNDVRPTLDGGRMMGELIAKEVERRLAERR